MDAWESRAMYPDELAKCRVRLERMGDKALLEFYPDCHHMCRMERGVGPRAPSIQQLVTAWRALKKRKLTG